ncbi:DUF202 domain-containing protein [Leucobacter ruminantium]|uniref:DUF202 domain-containing protein n=1 Tax=Leucobacter ruminantium TaxID=1289170 RepID=A0A939LZX9_9MICO|nr:DUF202 domain-containing protein [Leucobacter ruminantium]MBO1804525.1 DUF202 domain-containing protein [Leucobacter ruminantium]
MTPEDRHAARVSADPGLQPERTSMAWGRTTFAFVVASSVFLRWLPHFGARVLLLVVLGACAALAIFASQFRRYRCYAEGIERERLHSDPVAVFAIAGITVILAGFGLWLLAITP